MYSLNEGFSNSNGGAAAYGGSNMGFTMPVAPVANGYSAMPVVMGGCNNGMGGDWLGTLAIFALLFSGNRGGLFGGNDGNCAIPTIISDNVNGRFSAQSDQITAGNNSILAAISQNGIVDAVRAVGADVCAGFLQNANGFANVALENCRSTGVVTSAIADSKNAAIIETLRTQNMITESQYLSAISELRMTGKLSDCCCQIMMQLAALSAQGERQTCEIIRNNNEGVATILKQMASDKYDNLNEKYQAAIAELNSCKTNKFIEYQTDRTINTLSPRPTPSYPVFSPCQPIFNPVVSASSFCGAPGTSFGNNGCGNACGF